MFCCNVNGLRRVLLCKCFIVPAEPITSVVGTLCRLALLHSRTPYLEVDASQILLQLCLEVPVLVAIQEHVYVLRNQLCILIQKGMSCMRINDELCSWNLLHQLPTPARWHQ